MPVLPRCAGPILNNISHFQVFRADHDSLAASMMQALHPLQNNEPVHALPGAESALLAGILPWKPQVMPLISALLLQP